MSILHILNTASLATDVANKIYKTVPKIRPFKKKESLEELLVAALEWEQRDESDRRVFTFLGSNKEVGVLVYSINTGIHKHIQKVSDIPTNCEFYPLN